MKNHTMPFKYLPKDRPIQILELSRHVYHPPNVHMHDHCELLFITTEAMCQIVNNGQKHIAQAPAIILHRAGTYHCTETVKTGKDGYSSFVVFFTTELLAQLPGRFRHTDCLLNNDCLIVPLSETELAGFLPYLDMLRSESGNTDRMLMLLALILDKLAALSTGDGVTRLDTESGYILDAIKYMISCYDKPLSTEALAERYFVSVSKLNADFREVTGYSIRQFFIRLRLSRAADMLLRPGAEVAAVAYACGFSSESYFIQVFKRHEGATPGEYIQKKRAAEASAAADAGKKKKSV